jgi:hypothetical protein
MKNKTKVVLGLAAMVTGTVGVGATATFAWFTTQNSASAVMEGAHVAFNNSDISIEYVAVAQSGITAPTAKTAEGSTTTDSYFEIKGASYDVMDLSGDGLKFWRPNNFKSATSTCDSITQEYDAMTTPDASTNHASGKLMTFGIKIKNNSTTDTKVFLGSKTALSSPTTTDNNVLAANEAARKSTRVCIFSMDDNKTLTAKGENRYRTYWMPSATSATTYQIFQSRPTGNTDATYGKTDSPCIINTVKATSPASPIADCWNYGTLSDVGTPTPAQLKNQLVCTLAGKATGAAYEKTVYVTMWIDGFSATNTCIGGNVNLTLDLQAQNA